MVDFTFLTEKQIENNEIETLEKYGIQAAPTDFAIMLGAVSSCLEVTSDAKKGKTNLFEWRAGYYYLRNEDSKSSSVVLPKGSICREDPRERNNGIRPVMNISCLPIGIRRKIKLVNGIKEVEFGHYPQTVADENVSEKLQESLKNGTLVSTGNVYTTDSACYQDMEKDFCPRKHKEYEYNGERYISIVADENNRREYLSNSHFVADTETIWIKVEPIVWLVDEKSGLVISKKLLISGIQYPNIENVGCKFRGSFIKYFLDEYFSYEIGMDIKKENEMPNNELIECRHPYDFDFSEVSEEV